MIKKDDLKISKANGISGNDFIDCFYNYSSGKSIQIAIGEWTIAYAIQTKNGRWHLSNTYNTSFKDEDSLIKGLLRRLNK